MAAGLNQERLEGKEAQEAAEEEEVEQDADTEEASESPTGIRADRSTPPQLEQVEKKSTQSFQASGALQTVRERHPCEISLACPARFWRWLQQC